jgi:hypothetical protein
MSNLALERLIWVLIYGGLLAVCLGLFVRQGSEPLGWGFVLGGAATTAVGALLVWVRSKRPQ